jgi:ribonuclease HIII
MTSHTAPLTARQAEALRSLLAERGFSFIEKPHTLYAAEKKGEHVNVAVYAKGPKVLVQGKGTRDFIQFLLEPEVLGEATLGYEEEKFPDRYQPHFGIDESGKGDFFGPLVISGVFTDAASARHLLAAGVVDSKRVTSDDKVRQLAAAVRSTPGVAHHTVTIGPKRYNELYEKIRNLNRLLAWGHATVIERLLELRPDCPRALSDQFANPNVLRRALKGKGRTIQLDQRTKAESDPAVAAASILAREAFIDWLRDRGEALGLPAPLPKGVSPQVKSTARDLVRLKGPEVLSEIAKTHFKTAAEVMEG